ncbi:MAG: non-ribosomal peptide synthetase, partial [Deltaproteobacteria bacterium]|nr:non-ribosomal peptide synthetase [Deltaproteobacteria bacterium]
LLSAAQRHQLLHEWSSGAVAGKQVCLHRQIALRARRTPGAPAVVRGTEVLSYGELDRRAERLSRRLRGRGVGPADVVAVALPRSPELVVALLAVWKAGAAYLPLEPGTPPRRRQLLLADAGVRLVLDGELDGDGNADLPAPDPDRTAYVLFTPGSPGRPKGVAVSHRALASSVGWAVRAYGLGPGGSSAVHTSLGFDLTVTSLWGPLASGGRAVLLPEEDGVEALADWLAAAGADDLVKLTPSHLEALEVELADRPAAGAGVWVVGGETWPPESLRRWRRRLPAARFFNEYGPTEATVGCAVWEAGEPAAASVPIGRPAAGADLHVLGEVPPGSWGELAIGGPGLARAYLGRPALTAASFVPHPCGDPGERLYRTGDLARQLADGRFELAGRRDHQVKLRGYRLELGEIEAALAAHPAVRRAVAVVHGRRLAAAVAAAETVTAGGLVDFLRQRLPSYMIPAVFAIRDGLPLSAHGKVDREAVAGDISRSGESDRYLPPRGPAEQILARIWAHLLGHDRVGADEDFFELGGDSILSIQVVARARREGLSLQARDLFQHPTVAELALAA